MKKLLSILMAMALIVSFGAIPSYAAENQTKDLDNIGQTAPDTLKVVGSYDANSKEEAINKILSDNPDALIFTSLEEYDAYVAALVDVEFYDYMPNISTYSYRATKGLRVNISGTAYINVYYDYFVDVGGFVYEVYQDSIYSSMTGYSPGITYQERLLSVKKKGETHIFTDLTFSLDYYLLIDNFIKIGSKDFRYQFDHDCCTNTSTFTQVY